MSETPIDTQRLVVQRAFKIGQAIQKISKYTPWESKCLVQAMTGQFILKIFRIPSTLYLGMAKEKEEPNRLVAHAWLRCGGLFVTGGKERKEFKTVAYFSNI